MVLYEKHDQDTARRYKPVHFMIMLNLKSSQFQLDISRSNRSRNNTKTCLTTSLIHSPTWFSLSLLLHLFFL